MFWPIAQGAFLWAGSDFPDDMWLFREYFLDPYVAALVLGLVASRWALRMAAVVPVIGAVAAVTVTVGLRETVDTETYPTYGYGSAWSAYLEAALPWLWIAGLITVGVVLSRRVGSLRFDR
jgi:hypothetical protein